MKVTPQDIKTTSETEMRNYAEAIRMTMKHFASLRKNDKTILKEDSTYESKQLIKFLSIMGHYSMLMLKKNPKRLAMLNHYLTPKGE